MLGPRRVERGKGDGNTAICDLLSGSQSLRLPWEALVHSNSRRVLIFSSDRTLPPKPQSTPLRKRPQLRQAARQPRRMQSRPGDLQLKDPTTLIFVPALLHPTIVSGTARRAKGASKKPGLHPAGDTLPYVLGHLMFVPSETGASYGDLDEQYLTASYRVYLNEADAKKVFAYIKRLQATSPVWNAGTTNCTNFIGRIASFMGLKAPFHLLKPEEYINKLRALNGGRQTVQLVADR